MKRLFVVLLILAAAVVLVLIGRLFYVQLVVTQADYEPLLLRGDRVLVERTGGVRDLVRGDSGRHALPPVGSVLAYRDPVDNGRVLIGRLIGVPGDTLLLPCREQEEVRVVLDSVAGIDTLMVDSVVVERPFVVPGRDVCIEVAAWNIRLLAATLALHEDRDVALQSDTAVVVDGKAQTYISTRQDYCWIESLNDFDGYDSRVLGFVPRSLIVGRLRLTSYSHNPDTPFYAGYRWERFFKPLPAE